MGLWNRAKVYTSSKCIFFLCWLKDLHLRADSSSWHHEIGIKKNKPFQPPFQKKLDLPSHLKDLFVEDYMKKGNFIRPGCYWAATEKSEAGSVVTPTCSYTPAPIGAIKFHAKAVQSQTLLVGQETYSMPRELVT